MMTLDTLLLPYHNYYKVYLPTSPIATFLLFFTESFFEMIVDETNRYIQHVWVRKPYIVFMVLMRIICLPFFVNTYWKKDPCYHYAPITNQISRDRFMEMEIYLNFVDNLTLTTPDR